MKYRIFTKDLGWADCMYLFNENISYKMIKQTIGINILNKDNYVGKYILDDKFISYFDKKEENNIVYYII